MSSDQTKNLKLVSLVESYPCLYDYRLNSYTRTDVKENAWEEISKQIGDPAHVCKDRFRNIKAVFSRHLNKKTAPGPTPKWQNRYYLEDSLQFLLPFIKRRRKEEPAPATTLKQETIILEADTGNYEDENIAEPESYQIESENSQYHENAGGGAESSIGKCLMDYYEAKRKNMLGSSSECADQKFLLSLLPDMKQMNPQQKRKFKREILEVVNRIFEA